MSESEAVDILADLRKTLRWLVIATAVLYVFMIGFVVKVYFNSQHTNDALCTFRNDLISQVIASNKFLTEHPEGIPGVSVKTLTDSINRQQRTILSLKGLNCPNQP